MNVKEERICRLCLTVAEKDFKIVDEITMKMFAVLLLRVNLEITKDPIICKDCAEVMKKCFNFKTVCINKEELLFTFAIDKNRATFEFKDIYKDTIDIEAVDDNFICRFCSNKLSGSNCVLLDALMNDVTFAEMLLMLMPEMDFNMIKDPVICVSCRQDLECYFKFVENCLDVEEKITRYFQNEGTPSSVQIKLSEILYLNNLKFNYTEVLIKQEVIKQEEDSLGDKDEAQSKLYDGDLIKAEEALEIKEERVNINETIRETPSEMSMYKLNVPREARRKSYTISSLTVIDNNGNTKNHIESTKNISEAQVFKCDICTYQAKYKGNLKIHMLIHKDITEVEMYKCSMCTYQAKIKGTLKTHNMLMHKDISEVEMFKCSMCTYQSKQKGSLKIHMLTHKDIAEVEMYKCSMCTYQAKHKGSLKIHMLTHKDVTEVEMYKCSMCSYQAKHKSNLINHMLIHKDSTKVEMYKCSMCTHETKHKHNLKRHFTLIHKDVREVKMYNCSMCTYETKRKDNLKKHVLIHIREGENYKCTVCTYETKQKNRHKKHMLIHK